MDTRRFRTEDEHQAKTTGVGEHDADEAGERHDTAAVNRSAVTKRQERVNADCKDGHNDQVLVEFDILAKRVKQPLQAEQVNGDVLGVFGPLVCHFVHLLLPAQVRLLVDLLIATVLNNVSVLNGLGALDLVETRCLFGHWVLFIVGIVL